MCFETECIMTLQGHPRSLILAPIESAYGTSYWSLIVTLVIIVINVKQESPAIADKPARRESMPKIARIRRSYNVVADNTGLSSFV